MKASTIAQCIVIPLSTLWRGFVFSKLWLWFVVPLGMPGIGLAHSVGLSTLVSFLTLHVHEIPKETVSSEDRAVYVCIVSMFVPTSTLVLGYAAKLCL